MSDFLFDVPEVKSPRLLWLEKHSIKTEWEMGKWCAESPTDIAYGDNEDEAITQLALKLGIKLWNEEVESAIPNLIEAGDISKGPDVIRYALLIECASQGQLQKAMRTGTVSFTVFGAEKEGGQP